MRRPGRSPGRRSRSRWRRSWPGGGSDRASRWRAASAARCCASRRGRSCSSPACWLWRRERTLRPWLVACAVAVPALWFVPEWLGSGDVLRSGERARVSVPGLPVNEAVPAWAALREAAALPLWPLWLGAALCFLPAARAARPVVYAGLAWIALVAVMAQAGFSGEPRYSLPGGALVAIAGAAALVLAARAGAARLGAAAPAALPRARGARRTGAVRRRRAQARASRRPPSRPGVRRRARHRPRAGDRRGRWARRHPRVRSADRRQPPRAAARVPLDVEKQRVQLEPVPPAAVFRSRLRRDSPLEPAASGFERRAAVGAWELRVRCA